MVFALIITGAYNVTQLPIDAVPDITNNQVLVITSSPSLGAADIERLITFPIEQSTISIPGIIEQRSFSRFGLSLVTIVFNEETDVYWARQQVIERLQQVQDEIPPELGTPTLGPVTTGLGEIFQYVVKPKPGYKEQYDVMELRTIQDWIVRRQLLGTPGVADVSSFGGKLKQYEIGVDYNKLKSYNITISEIFDALEKNNQNTGGAYIEKGPTVLFIRSEGLVRNLDDIGNVMIKTLPDGTPISIRDVADVKIGTAIRYGALTYNDEGEVAGGIVMMLEGANSNKVIKDVKARIAQIEKTLPEGVMIEPFLDRTKMVNNAIKTVETNLLEGALIVVLILVLFLGNLRAGLLVASVIPLSMLFAIIMMNLFGVSGNLMSLGALDFGLIIDGAVIIVEAVMHQLHKNKKFAELSQITQKQMDDEVNHSASKMMNAAVFGQIIILIVYLPILTLQGVEGKMFGPMAQTVSFAIIGAFILSLTYIPMMSSLIMNKKLTHKDNFSDRIMRRFERVYKRAIEYVLAIPKIVIGTTAVIFVGALLLFMTIGGEFIPQLEEGDFAVDTRVLTGSSLTTTIESTQQASHILLQFPEVEKVVTKIGSGEIPTDPMPIEASDMMVILKPKKQWTSAKTFDELAEKMSKALEDVPGITAGFQYPVQMRFNELMTGGKQDVICKIFGENLDTLALYAERIGAIVNKVNGAQDVYVEPITGLPQIVVNYNRAALREYGLSIVDANNTLQSAFAGAVSGQVFENERRFDLVVRLNEESKKDMTDIQNLLIATPSGQQIPLSQVADVSIEVGINQIQREDAQRRVTVGFNVRGEDVQSVVHALQEKIDSEITFPPAYYITYGGDFENLVAAKKRLSVAVPIALLLIFILLYFAFHSIKQGLLIFSAIPLSAIGGVVALWLRDMPFSISAGVGFIALFGVAVLNGIVLITEFNHLKKAGELDVRTRILEGTRTRLRPVLMTAAVASFGFLPMALSKGAGAEVQRPLATVVIGGLITATFLTLLVLPILYSWMETPKKSKNKKTMLLKSKNLKAIIILVSLMSFANTGNTQETISLQAAIDTLMNQNLNLQVAELKTLSLEKLEKSAVNIPLTNISGEYGNVNSAYNDTKFGIEQTLDFPVVYKKQKQLLQAKTQSNKLQEDVIKIELRKQVTYLFYEMRMLQEKKALLQKADSLYQTFLIRQERRFEVGEANLLEKTAAETQRMQIANQLQQIDNDLKMTQSEFSRLLHSDKAWLPEPVDLKMTLKILPDSSSASSLPQVKLSTQQEEIALREIAVYKTKLLPQVSLAYFNQSFIGQQTVNGIDYDYSASKRFSAGELGLHIPIFNGASKAQVTAGKINYLLAQAETENMIWRQRSVIQQQLLKYERNRQNLDYYESSALKQARILTENAQRQFEHGNINYVEWIMLTNQSISIQSEYLNALNEWNNTIIELNSFMNN